MFCPRCAAENQDQTRFCRSCGADIEAVALALSGQVTSSLDARGTEHTQNVLAQSGQKLKIDGIRQVIQGALLFCTGALLGVPLALFSANSDWHSNWILIWLIFCGWIPVWGAITLGNGVSALIHSRMARNELDRLSSAANTAAIFRAGEIQPVETQQIIKTQSTAEASPASGAGERTTAPSTGDTIGPS